MDPNPPKPYFPLARLLLAISIISLLAGVSFLYSENTSQKATINQLQTSLNSTKTKLFETEFRLNYLRDVYSTLLVSNVTPPISKLEAVSIALTRGGYNSSSLRGLAVSAKLCYVSFFEADYGGIGFDLLSYVTEGVSDYSPKVEFNVYEPGAAPPRKGTVRNCYVWIVTVDGFKGPGEMHGVPPNGIFYVDASTKNVPFYYNGMVSMEKIYVDSFVVEKLSDDAWCKGLISENCPGFPVIELGKVLNTAYVSKGVYVPNWGRTVTMVTQSNPEYFRIFEAYQREHVGFDPDNHFYLGFITSDLKIYLLGLDAGLD